MCYSLAAGGVRVSRFGHALVMEAFVGPRPAGYEVSHRDGDASNNHVRNLRYATRQENQHDRRFHEKHGRKVRHGEPVFINQTERRRLASLRDRIGRADPEGADLIDGILARVGEKFGRRRDKA